MNDAYTDAEKEAKKEAQLLAIFENTEREIKKTVDGWGTSHLAAALVLYSATLLESSINAIKIEDQVAMTKMVCGVIRQTIRNTVGIDTFNQMMQDDSMKAFDKAIDVADKMAVDREKWDNERTGIYG